MHHGHRHEADVRRREKAQAQRDQAEPAPGAGRAKPRQRVSRERMEHRGRSGQQSPAGVSSASDLDDGRQDAERQGGQQQECERFHGSASGLRALRRQDREGKKHQSDGDQDQENRTGARWHSPHGPLEDAALPSPQAAPVV